MRVRRRKRIREKRGRWEGWPGAESAGAGGNGRDRWPVRGEWTGERRCRKELEERRRGREGHMQTGSAKVKNGETNRTRALSLFGQRSLGCEGRRGDLWPSARRAQLIYILPTRLSLVSPWLSPCSVRPVLYIIPARVRMENPHNERQAILLQRIVKSVVRAHSPVLCPTIQRRVSRRNATTSSRSSTSASRSVGTLPIARSFTSILIPNPKSHLNPQT